MSGNDKGEGSAQADAQLFQGVKRPGRGMIYSTRRALDMGVVCRREALLEIVGVLPQVDYVADPPTAAEAGRVEQGRESVRRRLATPSAWLQSRWVIPRSFLGVCQW